MDCTADLRIHGRSFDTGIRSVAGEEVSVDLLMECGLVAAERNCEVARRAMPN